MLHVIINKTRYNLADSEAPDVATVELVQVAQAAMKAAGEESVSILDIDESSESVETGDDLADEIDPKAFALAKTLDVSPLGCGYDGWARDTQIWTSDGAPGRYLVLEESECDEHKVKVGDEYFYVFRVG